MLRGTGIGRGHIERIGGAHTTGVWRSALVLGALVVAAAGCSGSSSDDASPPETSDGDGDPTSSAVTTESTTSPPTSTPTTTPATSPPSTTTPATTSTTTAPPTTNPPASPEDGIRAAYEERFDGYWSCLRTPLDCDTSYLLPGGGSESGLQATMQALADRDRYVGDDDVGYYVIEDISFESDDEVIVTACWWSTAVLYGAPIDPDRPVGPDNPPTIVNNTPSAGKQADRFVRVDEGWLLSSSALIDDGFPEDICAS